MATQPAFAMLHSSFIQKHGQGKNITNMAAALIHSTRPDPGPFNTVLKDAHEFVQQLHGQPFGPDPQGWKVTTKSPINIVRTRKRAIPFAPAPAAPASVSAEAEHQVASGNISSFKGASEAEVSAASTPLGRWSQKANLRRGYKERFAKHINDQRAAAHATTMGQWVTQHFSEVNGVPIVATTPPAAIDAIPPLTQTVTVTISYTSGTVFHLG